MNPPQSPRGLRGALSTPSSLTPLLPPPPEAFERSSRCVRGQAVSSALTEPHAAAAVPQSRTRRSQERTPRAPLQPGFNHVDFVQPEPRVDSICCF